MKVHNQDENTLNSPRTISIKPIIRKNLIYAKRSLFSTLFQLFFPCIIIGMFINTYMNVNEDKGMEEKTYENYKNILYLGTNEKAKYFNYRGISSQDDYDSFAIIGDNSNLSEKLTNYLTSKDKSICIGNCAVMCFTDRNEYEKFINSAKYMKSNTTLTNIIEIREGGSANLISFRISSSKFIYTSEWFNLNEFNITPDFYKIDKSNQEALMFQYLLINFLLDYSGKNFAKDIKLITQPMKSPKLISSNSEDIFLNIVPVIMSISYISILFKFVLWMVAEKEKKLKDLLARQGISTNQYFLSWLISFIILTIVPITLNSVLLTYFIFPNTNFLFIFLNLFLFSLTILPMALVFHQFVDNVRSGQALLKMIYIGISILSVVVNRDEVNIIIRYMFSIFPQTILKNSFELFLQTKNFPNGMDLKMMFAIYKDSNMFVYYLSYIIDFIIYFFFAFFLQSYLKSGLGFFQFILSFCGKQKKNRINNNSEEDSVNQVSLPLSPKVDAMHEEINHQDLLTQSTSGENLKILHVTKNYDKLRAVDDFSCELYKGQIFVLLGHNGAGKSTLINMISNMEKVDKGDIIFDNKSLLTNKDFLYTNLGLCSQEDIFFEDLTVQEHLEIVSEIKGVQRNMDEMNDLLTKIDLVEKKDTFAKNLSGGQRRKLCIALALIGNSKIILLDEPTSGMDVTAKRALWHFLKNYKSNKIIILTTHSLDEAEFLADRIGIMSEGHLICTGTSSFLKNKYSCGYNINFLFSHTGIADGDRRNFIDELKFVEPNLTIKVMSKETIAVNIPVFNQDSDKVFEFIDNVKQKFSIINYTLSTTTLEDVFLSLNSDEVSKNLFNDSEDTYRSPTRNTDESIVEADEKLINKHKNVSINTSSSRNEINEENMAFTEKQVGFCTQLKLNSKRHIFSLWRNKKSFVIELLACSVTFFIYIFLFKSFFNNAYAFSSYNNLLAKSSIYYGEGQEIPADYFTKYFGGTVDNNNKINLIQLENLIPAGKKVNTISDFDKIIFDDFYYHNIKTAFYVKEFSNNNVEIYMLYHPSSEDFQIAIVDLIVSGLLRNELGIDSKVILDYQRLPQFKSHTTGEDVVIASISLFLLISGFINLGAYMIIVPLRERILNVAHLQYLSGVSMLNYWISIGIADTLKFLIFVIIVFPFLLYTDSYNYYTLILILFFIIASLLFTYNMSFMFDKEENGQKYYLMLSYMSIIIMAGYSFYRDKSLIFNDNFSLQVSSFFPAPSLVVSMVRLWAVYLMSGGKSGEFANQMTAEMQLEMEGMGDIPPVLPKIEPWNIIRNSFFEFLIQVFFHGALVYLRQNKVVPRLVKKLSKKPTTSSDSSAYMNSYVQEQKEKTERASAEEYSVKIKGLSKTYKTLCSKSSMKAVNDLHLALEANEKFGLMGFNGSGKTTTFKSITDEILFDSGSIELFGHDVVRDFETLRKDIGYCPQNHAIFDHMTVSETFDFYMNIKSGRRNFFTKEELLAKFGLKKFKDTECVNLSGGNKRKLNFAIALMSTPRIVLLDEPSTGVDPESRRMMWKNINDIPKHSKKFNMLLSTHSMEEAEILCDTIGWMRAGNFVCLGNPEKLKLQFSQGYYLFVKFRQPNFQNINPSVLDVNDKFKGLEAVLENFQTDTVLNIPDNGNYVYFFEKLEEVVYQIRSLCGNIKLSPIDLDNTGAFEVVINVESEKQGYLFLQLLKLKSSDENILEINLHMQSLENILTSL